MKVMIIGGGKVGTYLATYLLKEKHEVKVIELRSERAAHAARPAKQGLSSKRHDPDMLESAHPQDGCGCRSNGG